MNETSPAFASSRAVDARHMNSRESNDVQWISPAISELLLTRLNVVANVISIDGFSKQSDIGFDGDCGSRGDVIGLMFGYASFNDAMHATMVTIKCINIMLYNAKEMRPVPASRLPLRASAPYVGVFTI
jgi:hypothetical protein